MSEPLISVIITTYKRPVAILDRAVRSVLDQDYPNLELIVVNDCPEDEALEAQIREKLLSYADQRIIYKVQEANGGACKARNEGLKCAKGAFIAFLDDDDAWLPQKLTRQMTGFTSDCIGAVSCDFYDAGRGKGKHETVFRMGSDKSSLIEALLWGNCVGGCSEPLIRASVFGRVGTFDESLPASQDYDLWMRIARIYEIAFIHEPLVRRYYSEDSITGNFEKKMKGFEIFQKKNEDLYREHPDALNYRYAQKIQFCMMHRHILKSIQFFVKAFFVKPISKYNVSEPTIGAVKFLRSFLK